MIKIQPFGPVFLTGACLLSFTVLAQNEIWELPRTSWGDPVIQGYWSNSSMVPLQRPAVLGTKEFYSIEEYRENLRQEFEEEYGELGL